MRTRQFRRRKRKWKIRKRQKMAVLIGKHGAPYTPNGGRLFEKLDAAIYGDKPGIFAKDYYGGVTCGKRKTRDRNRYGKVKIYKRHDQREIDRMEEAWL